MLPGVFFRRINRIPGYEMLCYINISFISRQCFIFVHKPFFLQWLSATLRPFFSILLLRNSLIYAEIINI
ncbi:MAG: hypothetical protein JWN60_3304 [Acidobacteria bacterium]|jgi:hypothetical protein|nr:hypothetical protein [Acidobacteriota bacterium]